MKAAIQHDAYGTITYEESFWTGKKTLLLNGTPLTRTDKTHFLYNTNGESVTVEVKGNALTGVCLHIGKEKIQLVEKPAWYVWTLSILMFAFIIVWGNSPTLCAIFPVVGGAIGGAISGVCAVLNVYFAGKTKNPLFKLLIGLGIFAVMLVVCYAIAAAILAAATAVVS